MRDEGGEEPLRSRRVFVKKGKYSKERVEDVAEGRGQQNVLRIYQGGGSDGCEGWQLGK